MNTETFRALRTKLEGKMAELEKLTSKGNEFSNDDLAAAERIQGEMVDLRTLMEAETKRAAGQDVLRTALRDTKSFLDDAAPSDIPVPHPANMERADEREPLGKVLAYTKAGETYIERKKDGSYEITNSGGIGLFTKTQYEKLCRKEYTEAFVDYIVTGGDERKMKAGSFRALQEGIDQEGGYLIPPEYVLQMIQRQPTPTSINPEVFRWQTTRDGVIFPVVNYTGANDDPNATLYSSGVRVTYPGEIPSSDTDIDTTEPSFGDFRVDIHTAMMALSISNNMLEDSPIGVMALIEEKFRETDTLELDNRILNGTGTGQAAGILRNPNSADGAKEPQFKTSGAAAAYTADGVRKFPYALAPQYVGRAQFIMNWMSSAQAIDQLKDGQGRYLWSEGQQDNGMSADILNRRLLGFRAIYSEFMPNVAANAFPMIFGDLRGYYLVERLGMSIQVLRETKAKRNQIEIIARRRFGGGVAEPWRLKVMKIAA